MAKKHGNLAGSLAGTVLRPKEVQKCRCCFGDCGAFETQESVIIDQHQREEWTTACRDWLPAMLVQAMFDLEPDFETKIHPGDYIGEWRQVTYEEVRRATGLSKNKVKRWYWDLWADDIIYTRVHRPRGDEMSSEIITARNGVSGVQMHVLAPWLRFNREAFAEYMQDSLEYEKEKAEEARNRAEGGEA
jgi:hypothetical protein